MVDQIIAIAEMQLRSRLNLFRRESWIGHVVTLLFSSAIATSAIGVLLIGLFVGYSLAKESSADFFLITWNGIAAFFVIAWSIYFSHDIFRSDAIPLQRVMHLPVSPAQAFGMNFFQTWFNLPMIYFAMASIGLIAGEAIYLGPWVLWQLVPVLLHALMITSIISLVQARVALWLFNPRTRRLVLVLVPALVGLLSFGFAMTSTALRDRLPTRITVPGQNAVEKSQELGVQEESNTSTENATNRGRLALHGFASTLRKLDLVVPPMWFAGCMNQMTKPTVQSWFLMTSMLVVSIAALRSNYLLTLTYYQNGFDTQTVSPSRLVNPKINPREDQEATFIEKSYLGLDQTYSAIVSMSWLSLSRSPEIKLSILLPLMQPIIMMMLFGKRGGPQDAHWQFLAIVSLTALGLFLSSGFLCNIFGIDRSGFRFWVLSPIARHTILHARNIAFGLPALALSIAMGLGIAMFWKVSILVMLESLFSLLAFMPLYLMMTNLMSVLAPFPLPPGGMHPKDFSWKTLLMNLLLTLSLPFFLAWCCLPIGLEMLLQRFWPGLISGPVACIGLGLVFWRSWTFYHKNLPAIGDLMRAREIELLKIVTMHVEKK